MSLTVAITFFNSSRFLIPAILEPLNNPLVREIVIVNDGSTSWETAELIRIIRSLQKGQIIECDNTENDLGKRFLLLNFCARFLGFRDLLRTNRVEIRLTGNPEKIRLIHLANNVGAFKAKQIAVKESTSDYVLLLDGDNYLLESTVAVLALEVKKANEILCPNVQIMNFSTLTSWDFHNFRFLGFDSLSQDDLLGQRDRLFSEERLVKFLNTGNFLVPRETYLEISLKSESYSELVGAQDAMLMTLTWLLEGNFLRVVPGFHYFHRLHKKSFWRTSTSDRLNLSEMIRRIKAL